MQTTFADLDVVRLLRIAGEVGELERDTRVRRTHILERLLALVGGCWAVCSEVDPAHATRAGWALPDSITCAGRLSNDQYDVIGRYLTGQLGAVDPCVPPLLRERRRVVTVRRTDVVDGSWYGSEHFDRVRRPIGFGESMYGILTIPGGRRLKLSLHREMNDLPFTERHARLLQVFNENLAGLYVAPPRGTAAPPEQAAPACAALPELPPRLRPVLQRLLAGDAEKQAAAKLGLSPHTIHQYTKVLYRAFGVNSRGELLAKFVVTDGGCDGPASRCRLN